MDAFEIAIKKTKDKPAKYRKLIDNSFCDCIVCPSYTSCAREHKEAVFCLTGRSFTCIDHEEQCVCPTCPTWKNLGLKHTYYCTRGSEQAQRYQEEIWEAKKP